MRKSILFLAGIISAFFTVNAQLDVGVTGLPNLYNKIPVYSNVPIFVQYTRENLGSSAVTSADVDSFTMEIFVDQVKRQTFYRNMGSSFAVGASETRNGVNPMDWGSLGLTAGTYSTCVRTRLWKNGSLVDANPNNDESCEIVDYQSSPFSFDCTLENIVLPGPPQYNPGDFIPIPYFPDLLDFDLKNTGNTDLMSGLPIPFDLVVGTGSPVSGSPSLSTSVSQGGSTTINVSGLLGAGVNFPMTAGPFDVCITLKMNGDTNPSNDKVCATFNMGTGTGIEEEEFEVFGDVFYNGSELRLSFNDVASGIARVDIFEISGRTVANFEVNVDINKEKSIDVTDFSTGVYIANISVNGQVLPYKFAVK